MSLLPRTLHRFWAGLNGYFWLPCPVCHKMFGGHEAGWWSIPTQRPGISKCVCSQQCVDWWHSKHPEAASWKREPIRATGLRLSNKPVCRLKKASQV